MKPYATLAFVVLAVFAVGALAAVLWLAPALVATWRPADVAVQAGAESEE